MIRPPKLRAVREPVTPSAQLPPPANDLYQCADMNEKRAAAIAWMRARPQGSVWLCDTTSPRLATERTT